ncbi:MAG: translation initiation factor IF-3 [Bacteroidetes bacterium]|nr:translation initiation factor IF-3 [Bacteroidota bacterium]MCW5897017.1 translation initiation factor IF-3 [Bacteroidota bacterium]
MNEDIRATQIRVIDDRGAQLGVMSPRDAIQIARERDADLVEIVPNANPPVCKVINFGKFKYELAKKDKIQKKHQHVSLLKELRFHPNTDTHDFDFKVRHAINFLKDGHKVKASVVFKGREITYKEKGEDLLTRFSERVSEFSKVDQAPHMEGRSMIAIFAPERKKASKADDTSSKQGASENKKQNLKPEQAS